MLIVCTDVHARSYYRYDLNWGDYPSADEIVSTMCHNFTGARKGDKHRRVTMEIITIKASKRSSISSWFVSGDMRGMEGSTTLNAR